MCLIYWYKYNYLIINFQEKTQKKFQTLNYAWNKLLHPIRIHSDYLDNWEVIYNFSNVFPLSDIIK